MYDDFDDDDQRSGGKRIALVVVLALGGWFGYQKAASGDDGRRAGIQLDPTTSTTIGIATTAEPTPGSTALTETPTTERTTAAPTTTPAMALTRPSTTVATTTIATATTSIATATTSIALGPGSVLPNGVAVGVLVSFDGEAVTMRGALPNERALERLLQFVDAANTGGKPVVNEVAVNAEAPGGDSVRFVGLDPQPFPEGTNDIHPPHAAELDRIAELLNAFPDVAVIVIGRADQRGPTERNLGIAEGRADALVAYLVGRGIDAGRLSSVAFGELEPTNPDENVVALTLNRRAEFLIYGLAR